VTIDQKRPPEVPSQQPASHEHERYPIHEHERYRALFAKRTDSMMSSAIRDMMTLTEQDDVISLAGGLPDTSTFPAESYARLMASVADQACARALQYGPTEGLASVRECITRVMAAEGTQVSAENVMVTTGGQQAIDLVTKILIDPGDVIIAEGPSYPGALPTFCSYQADVIQVEVDADGMRIDALQEALERLDREGRRPKFVYTIPNFHNPAGVTMSLPRRRGLIEIARERGLVILEDNPYGLLRFEGEPLPSLHSLAPELVLYAGTFSKILSPGTRIGWLVAPPPVLDKLVLGKGATDLCSSSITQFFVAEHFATAPWRDYVRELVGIYRRRRDVMIGALAEYMPPETTWTHPHGGLFIWVTLPDYIDTSDLLARAVEHRVAFVPGRAAYIDGRGGSSMRLNFSGVKEDEIHEGVRRLGDIVDEQVAMYSTLTGVSSRRSPAAERTSSEAQPDAEMARVLRLPRRA